MSVPPNPQGYDWLWVGWSNTQWVASGNPEHDRQRADAVYFDRLIILMTITKPPRSPRFYIHKDLIDE
jgi:hypothetical protein